MLGGRVVVLNGGSSAGKSSLARALQDRWAERGECWVVLAWDDFVPRLPARWFGIPAARGDLASEGANYRVLDEQTASFDLGRVGRRMVAAYHRAVAAFARSGLDVLVDEVVLSEDDWVDWSEALDGLDVRWVAVRCDLDVAIGRERQRGDRLPGLARGTSLAAHRHVRYDAEIDTTSAAVHELATEVDALLTW